MEIIYGTLLIGIQIIVANTIRFVISKEHRLYLPFLSWPPECIGQSCTRYDAEATSFPVAGVQRGPQSLQCLRAAGES